MSMIVARMQKMKAENLVGIGNHNQRKTKNHNYLLKIKKALFMKEDAQDV